MNWDDGRNFGNGISHTKNEMTNNYTKIKLLNLTYTPIHIILLLSLVFSRRL